jgi:hypothetical protein
MVAAMSSDITIQHVMQLIRQSARLLKKRLCAMSGKMPNIRIECTRQAMAFKCAARRLV